MESNEIQLGDWARMFEGQVPHVFLIEVVIRMFFAFLLLTTSIRLMGNRMASDLSKIELVSRIMLAAAIGLPLQAPDRGLLGSVIVASVAVALERFISRYASRHRRFEKLTQDNLDILISDAVMDIDTMKRTRITRERLFAQLRSEGIEHLGEIRRFYFEAHGAFTLVKQEEPSPGLSVIPDWDEELRKEQKTSNKKVCTKCGRLQGDKGPCSQCGNEEFGWAVIS